MSSDARRLTPDAPSRAQQLRAAAAAARTQRQHIFELPETGGEAVVRRLDLMELIALDAIPATLQAVVNDILAAQLGGAGDEPALADVLRAAGGPLAALRQQQQLADAACLVGFIDPKLVATAADVVDDTTELALDEIARADRLAYWTWCQGGEEAGALATAFPEPAAAAAAGPPEQSVRDEPVDLPLRAAAPVRR